MKVTLTQEVEGHAALETVEVDADRAHWLVDHGYATLAKVTDVATGLEEGDTQPGLVAQDTDKAPDETPVQTTDATADPTLAENRETPDAAELTRPAKDARKADWVAYAEAKGIDPSGTKDAIQARVRKAKA